MWHIDEGGLHAWLDHPRSGLTEAEYGQVGAHLARCAECAALLVEARALRERSGEILALAGPTPRVQPELEELRRRADASGTVPQRRRNVVALAWAASIVAALGLGWFARSQLGREQIAMDSQMAPAPELATATESFEEFSADAPTAAEGAQPPLPAPASRGVVGGLAAEAPFVGAGASGAPAVEEALRAAAEDLSSTPQATLAQPVPRPLAGRASVADAAAATTAPTREGVTVATLDRLAAQRSAPVSVEGAAPGRAAFAQAADQAAPAAAPAAPAAPPLPPAALPAPSEGLIVWEVVPRAEAERRLGVPVLTHPTLPVVRFEVTSVGSVVAIRVIQTLPGGQILTLTQSRGALGGAAGAAGVSSSSVIRGSLRITVAAPVSADSIGALLEGVR